MLTFLCSVSGATSSDPTVIALPSSCLAAVNAPACFLCLLSLPLSTSIKQLSPRIQLTLVPRRIRTGRSFLFPSFLPANMFTSKIQTHLPGIGRELLSPCALTASHISSTWITGSSRVHVVYFDRSSLKNRLLLLQFRLRFHPHFYVVPNAFNLVLPLLLIRSLFHPLLRLLQLLHHGILAVKN